MNPKKPPLKKITPLLLIIVLAVSSYRVFKHEEATNGRLVFYGNVDIRQVRPAFFSTGRIIAMLVKEGDRVKQGQLLAELDASRYTAAVARAEALVAAQEQAVARMQAGSRPEEIAEAEARARAAGAASTNAAQKQVRLQALAGDEYVSKQQIDDIQTAVETADANLDAMQQIAALVKQGPRKEDIAIAEAKLKADQAALAMARQELIDTKLYAPSDGVVQNRILEPGDMASPQQPVYTIALDNPVWVRTYVPEPKLGKIAEGMKAEVTTDSYPDKTYQGQIGTISPTAEFTPKQVQTTDLRSRLVYQVRVYVDNPNNELRLGMPATVRIIPGTN